MHLAIKYGMTVREFYKSTERELSIFITAKVSAQKEQRVHDWEIARHVMRDIRQQYSDKILTVQDVMRMEHDSDRKELSDWENQELKKWNKLMDEGPRAIIPK